MNLNELFTAQLAYANELASTGHHTYSDDGLDYLTSALRLAHDLLTIEPDKFEVMFKQPEHDDFILNSYACDGICPAIYDVIGEENVTAWEEL